MLPWLCTRGNVVLDLEHFWLQVNYPLNLDTSRLHRPVAKMPYSLKGRNVLVTGGSRYIHSLTSSVNRLIKANRGLGALLCERFAAEGCNIVVNYVSSESAAKELAEKVEKEYSIKSCIIQGVRDLAMKPMVFYSCVPSRTLDLQQIMLDWLRKPLRSSVA
jgi:hypothetical protein